MINDDNNDDDDNSIIIICIIIFIAVNLLVFTIFNIPFLLILSSFCTISFVIIHIFALAGGFYFVQNIWINHDNKAFISLSLLTSLV